ncbi:DUF202 domain-containing protein [Plectonema cf. radiosum LEGE 06105]|uniref:DUF202 domain-containing protein n=1 Tax=Plectonema cf. radiosum LEGE 06105 TaxID=945769 RepID=A0A8J7K8C1_9CYAN|nr:DUF202 domain-containing protein [Plectonema radiosum]MBE9216957.1 DUF202 domain-containing protein [Plectonema cf. radiosum LEGE 06105]
MANQNRESRLREHLANERTFLAWLRTSISLIGFGLAIARFGLFLRQLQTATAQEIVEKSTVFNYQNLGLTLIIVGILILALATLHYNRVFKEIEEANYQPNRLLIWFLSSVLMLLGLLSIPLILVRRNSTSPIRNPPQPQSRK